MYTSQAVKILDTPPLLFSGQICMKANDTQETKPLYTISCFISRWIFSSLLTTLLVLHGDLFLAYEQASHMRNEANVQNACGDKSFWCST